MDSEKNKENIDELIANFLRRVISQEEMEELRNWLSADNSNKAYFKQTYLIWKAAAIYDYKSEQTEKAYENLLLNTSFGNTYVTKKSSQNSGKTFTITFLKIAAMVVISLISGALLHILFQKNDIVAVNNQLPNVINVPLGAKSTVTLPDGSEVYLNAGSKLSYTMNFGKTLREVNLIGEGYFKVAKQHDKPFIVHTTGANVKAVGTEFNVKAYPDEKMIETILVKGSVIVYKTSANGENLPSKDSESVVLQPGQKARIYKSAIVSGNEVATVIQNNQSSIDKSDPNGHINTFNLKQSSAEIETSWKDSRWIIQRESLTNLFILLNRRYNVSIIALDTELSKYRFSGTIQNETLEQVLSIVGLTTPISYKIEKDKVEIGINQKLENRYKRAYKN